MVTISDKRYGELLANSLSLDVYKNIASYQYKVIEHQMEASKLGMAEIKRLREELASVHSYSKTLEEVIESVKDSVKDL